MTEEGTDRPPRRRGPAYDRSTIAKAKEMRRYGDSYRAIASALGVPATTVQYWTQDVVADKSGRWTLAEAARATDPDPAVVLPVLGAVIASSHGRVTGMTRDEARWVTFLARARPDLLTSGPTSTWQLAREYLEAIAAQDETELWRKEQLLAQGAARLKWPGHDAAVATPHEKAERVAADLQAGRNPFLDGRPYQPEDER